MDIIFVISGIVLFFIFIFVFCLDNHKKKKVRDLKYYESVSLRYMIDQTPVSLEEIQKRDHTFQPEYFLFTIFCLLRDIQRAWSEMNLVQLNTYVDSKLFEFYQKAIHDFNEKGQKNMFYDIMPLQSKLCSFRIEKDREIAEVLITISCYDYLVAVSSQRVLAGTNKNKLAITYLLEVEKKLNSHKKDDPIICSNCHQLISEQNQIRCPFCNSELVPSQYDWIVVNKRVLSQTEIK